jgi:hypothetical protein
LDLKCYRMVVVNEDNWNVLNAGIAKGDKRCETDDDRPLGSFLSPFGIEEARNNAISRA